MQTPALAPLPARVSVILTCSNAAAYVGEAIESVLVQSRPCDELIVVDDGSDDTSAQVIQGFGAALTCVRQESLGVAAARNRGVLQARGDIVAFLDAEDLWPADSLATRLACLDAHPGLDYAFGWVEPFFSPDIPEPVRAAIGDAGLILPGRVAGSLLVRRRVFESVGLFNNSFRVGEALEWITRANAAGFRSRDVGAIVLRRRLHGTESGAHAQQAQHDHQRILRTTIGRSRLTAGRAYA
ncbi:MAG TPA: glycosyltransferase family A protein [Rhodocyclaceae bacterium]|nr:glycosyltransferase family A protein [Rhodocyclaceae bacterium]